MPQVSMRGREILSVSNQEACPFGKRCRKRGLKVYRLNIGQPDVPTPQKAFEALKSIERKILEYSPSEGLLSLRKN